MFFHFFFIIVCTLVFVKESCGVKKYTFRGCFEYSDRSSLVTGFKQNFEKTLTPKQCVDTCAKKQFPFAGVEKHECRCGHHFPSDTIRRSDLECDTPCPGNATKNCGGPSKVSVYETGVAVKDPIPSRVYLGCFNDEVSEYRILKGSSSQFNDNSPEKCHRHCHSSGFKYFGLTYIQECFCGDTPPAAESLRGESECDSQCNGSPDEFCGGSWRLSVYATGITDIPETGRFVNCYKNARNNEAKVEYSVELPKSNTNRRCLNICNERSFKYSSIVQNRTSTCICMNVVPPAIFIDDDYNCIKDDCPGDSTEKCGSKDRIRIFRTRHGDVKLDTSPKFLGCFQDKENFRALEGSRIVLNEKLTPSLCVDICKNRNYAFSGVEVGNECFCGNTYPTQYAKADEAECKSPCTGDVNSYCGGALRISVYSTGFPRAQARVNRWYLGCYKDDDKDNRMLRGQWSEFENNSPDVCHKHCLKIGYEYFGVTWIKECFCGDEDPWEDLRLNDSECSKECGGDSNQKCGGSWRLSVYRTGIYDFPDRADNYLGCFHNNDNLLLTERKIELPWSNLPNRCTNICDQLGFAYAGVERAIECRCGNKAPKRKREADSKCNDNCPGFSGNKCGAQNYVKIFRTTVSEQVAVSINPSVKNGNCRSTDTTHNGQNACKNDSLLNEPFDVINSSIWSHTIKMALDPDYEFVTYSSSPEVIHIKNGILVIKPEVQTFEFTRNNLTLANCTGKPNTEECSKVVVSSNIVPPVLSAQITTKNSVNFRYGRLEIRAKLPEGDWIIPEIWLSPKDNVYGANYQSGQIRLAMIRGNKDLVCNGEKLGNKFLQTGIYFGPSNAVKKLVFTKEMPEGWLSKFHDFSLLWTTDNISFYVDGEKLSEVIKNPGETVRTAAKLPSNVEHLWQDGSKLAPFDKEFYITLGVSVGGINDFPDGCTTTNGVKKPWANTSPKAMINFYDKSNQWKMTWKGETSALQVDHVRLNAL